MKDGTLANDTTNQSEARSGGLTASAAFPALVALWFAALFGAGCLFLPPVLFDALLGGASPFGDYTRIIFALVAAGLGLAMGLFIAQRVRLDDAGKGTSVPAPSKRSRKGGSRAPFDVRAALGLGRADAEDEEDDGDPAEYALSDENYAIPDDDDCKPPIDDPHFASAWSDADSADLPGPRHTPDALEDRGFSPTPAASAFARDEWADEDWEEDQWADNRSATSPISGDRPGEDWDAEPDPEPDASAPAAAPSRYNPFADHLTDEDALEEDDRAFAEPSPPEPEAPARIERPAPEPVRDEAPAPAAPAKPRADAPPPPPVWPTPRESEPELQELGVAELVERLARALQGQQGAQTAAHRPARMAPPRSGEHRHDSALAPHAPRTVDVDRALRGALDRLSRLDDVA